MNISPYVFPGIKRKPGLTPQTVVDTVCDFLGLSEEKVFSRSRKQEPLKARQLITYLLRYKLKFSFKRIGDLLHQDHTTAMHNLKAFKALLDTEDSLKAELNALNEQLLIS